MPSRTKAVSEHPPPNAIGFARLRGLDDGFHRNAGRQTGRTRSGCTNIVAHWGHTFGTVRSMTTKSETTTLSLDRYAAEARALVVGAQALADEAGHLEVQPLHLLARGLERDAGFVEVFRSAGVDVLALQSAVEGALRRMPRSREPAYLASSMLDLLERAEREAARERARDIQREHLLNALSQEIRGPAGEILEAHSVVPGALRPHLSALRGHTLSVLSKGGPSRTSLVIDLVQLAREGKLDRPIGRSSEIRRLLTVLERRQKSHPLLVGEPGVGKGAIVAALAHRLAAGDVPTRLVSVKVLQLDTGALLAGAKLRGEIEQRLRGLLDELSADHSECILVVRNVENLFGQGATGSGAGEILKPVMQRSELRILGTTSPDGRRRLEDRDPEALRAFTELPVEQPSEEEALQILRGVASRYEQHHSVEISEGAIGCAVRLARRYVQDRFLPDAALDLLDESAAAKRVTLDSMPDHVDEAVRRTESLEAQIASLADSEDPVSLRVRRQLSAELDALQPGVQQMRRELEARRNAIVALRGLREELLSTERQRDEARAKADYAKVGELEHVTLPSLTQRLDEATKAAERAGASEDSAHVDEHDVAETLARWTGIPVARMLEGEAEKLLKMEERLTERVVGQHDAVGAVARAVRRGRVGLRDPKRPIGSFLFLGPSGVGKTELAKALAELLFDDEQALTRLDMSEFMERHMAQRLLGAPPGYADSERGGFLTEAVRRRPYSVLLFDEVEKAHQDVFNLLLQLLDDGRLTDGRGRLADFSNTVVIMTSNIGSSRILESEPKLFDSAEGREALRDVLLEELRSFFRPEFLNRIDEVSVFRPLGREHLEAILDLEIGKVERMLVERDLHLTLSPEARSHLVSLGYEPALGARPLKRVILKHLQDPLAEALLAGDFQAGTRVRATLSGDHLLLEPSGGAAPRSTP